MLQALGATFLNAEQREIGFGGEALSQIQQIDLSGLDSRLSQVEFEVACDVDNPLCGERGASAILGRKRSNSRDGENTRPRSVAFC